MCEGSHLEADPNLERSIIIHQDTGKTVCAQNNLYSEEVSALLLFLKNTLILNVPNVLNYITTLVLLLFHFP